MHSHHDALTSESERWCRTAHRGNFFSVGSARVTSRSTFCTKHKRYIPKLRGVFFFESELRIIFLEILKKDSSI